VGIFQDSRCTSASADFDVRFGVVGVRGRVFRQETVAGVVAVVARSGADAGLRLDGAVAHGVVGKRPGVGRRSGHGLGGEPVDAVVAVDAGGTVAFVDASAATGGVEGEGVGLDEDGGAPGFVVRFVRRFRTSYVYAVVVVFGYASDVRFPAAS
jgi:hypothetical protein